MKTKEQKNCEKIQSENTVNLGDFFENPNNPSKATPEQLERLAEKLKRIPIGLTAIRIAYVTDAPCGGKMVISGNKRLRVLKHYADVIRKRWAEFVHGEGCDWEKLTPATE